MKKFIIFLIILASIGVAYATITNVDGDKWFVGDTSTGAKVDADGNFLCTGYVSVSSATITSLSISSMTVTNLSTVDTVRFAVDLDTATTPSSAGIIGINSSYDVYVSTGTGAEAWVLIGSQS
ncbi:MAG: hypothetical protein WC343_03700 [Bacilli bacterium]|jgi:hypothetical protein